MFVFNKKGKKSLANKVIFFAVISKQAWLYLVALYDNMCKAYHTREMCSPFGKKIKDILIQKKEFMLAKIG